MPVPAVAAVLHHLSARVVPPFLGGRTAIPYRGFRLSSVGVRPFHISGSAFAYRTCRETGGKCNTFILNITDFRVEYGRFPAIFHPIFLSHNL